MYLKGSIESYANSALSSVLEVIKNEINKAPTFIDGKTFEAIKLAWNSTQFQQALNERFAYDSYHETLTKLVKGYPGWGGESWVPDWSDQYDTLRVTGVLQTDIVIRGLRFSIIDVGGVRSDRKKWNTCF